VELLVAIGIIGILAALLLSAINAAKDHARRTVCMNNLRQINLGVRMYSDDSNDKSPKSTLRRISPYDAYKELMKSYVGLRGASSAQDSLFACPADVFYYDFVLPHRPPLVGYVPESFCAQSNSDYSSYIFNGGNLLPHGFIGLAGFRPGIAGQSLTSIKHPARTVLVVEAPALIPFSWHQPKRPLYIIATKNCPNCFFNNARNMVSFVAGHASYVRIYRDTSLPSDSCAGDYDPPASYDYQWSGN
jgi:hypothetical protein